MTEHGPTWQKNQPGSRTVCKCGRDFADDRGFYVHLGKSRKLSDIVKSLSKEEKTK